jgi:hypothetical protein
MRLTVAAKAPATRDHVRGISGLSAPPNSSELCLTDFAHTVSCVSIYSQALSSKLKDLALRPLGGCSPHEIACLMY